MDAMDSGRKVVQIENNIERMNTGLQNLKWAFDISGQKDLYANTTNFY
jgi:hypothetical protein